MLLEDQPLLTDFFPSREAVRLGADRLYVFQPSAEERSRNQQQWLQTQGVQALELEAGEAPTMVRLGGSDEVALRNRAELQGLWAKTEAEKLCIDITGIKNDVWAPLVRAALDVGMDVKVMYVEPREYRFAPKPRPGEIFALSERREGLDQVPGFAKLDVPGEKYPIFIPLLGFEGARVRHALEELGPATEQVIPIVGAPGFRVEYPMHTFLGNELFLSEGEHWTQIQYAMANCPYAVYYKLHEIAARFPDAPMRIGLLGTKPHALGGALYAIAQERLPEDERRRVGLIHDRPVVRADGNRTTGTAHALLYDVSTFMARVA